MQRQLCLWICICRLELSYKFHWFQWFPSASLCSTLLISLLPTLSLFVLCRVTWGIRLMTSFPTCYLNRSQSVHAFLKIPGLFLHLRDFHEGKKLQKSWIIRWLWQQRWFPTPYNVLVTFLSASWEVTSRQVNGYLFHREVWSRQNRVQPKAFLFIIH